jgi:16S rRNA (guanine966-N2)-methyltransferase
LRVISGSVGGMKLESLKGYEHRPTAERVKEALFNIIGPQLVGSSFLDLYAGTGSIGIEALSRGAKLCAFVEKSQKAVAVIGRNLDKTSLRDRAHIFKCHVSSALNRLIENGMSFDYIFLDPPYEKGMANHTLKEISSLALKLLTNSGIIIVEESKREELHLEQNMTLIRRETYGDTSISFIKPIFCNNGS